MTKKKIKFQVIRQNLDNQDIYYKTFRRKLNYKFNVEICILHNNKLVEYILRNKYNSVKYERKKLV